MNTSLRRIRRGALVLASIFVLAVLGYRFIGNYDWIEAIWIVVVTISSVGYGEYSSAPTSTQILSILVIVLGMSAAVYTVGGLIQLMLEGEIESVLGLRRTTREIQRLSDHVIVCGFGRIGELLARDLFRKQRSFVVIDCDAERISEADQHQFLAIHGDAMEEEVLIGAGLHNAITVVTVLPNDAANVFITLTARNLNPGVQIIARAEHPSTEKKLNQAGANRVVMPVVTGATQMSRMITRPSTADLMELLVETNYNDIEMDEITISKASQLAELPLNESKSIREHELLVLAIKQSDGNMVFKPAGEYALQVEDTLIVMGGATEIERFRQKCEVEPNSSK